MSSILPVLIMDNASESGIELLAVKEPDVVLIKLFR